jgi:hypothetical protein
MSQRYSQGQLDAIARQRGFPNYATWAAWQQHRSEGLQQAPAQPPPQNFLQSVFSKIPLHPAYLLDYVNKKINGG